MSRGRKLHDDAKARFKPRFFYVGNSYLCYAFSTVLRASDASVADSFWSRPSSTHVALYTLM